MHPILFEIFGYPIRFYGLAMATAFIVDIWLANRRAPIEGQDQNVVINTCLWVVIGTLVGGRLLFAITQWEDFVTEPMKLIAFWEGGLVFYGGFIGSYMAAVGYLLWLNLPSKQKNQFVGMMVGLTFFLGYAFSLVRVLNGDGIKEGFTHWLFFWNYGLHLSVGFLASFAITYTYWSIKTRGQDRENRIMPILDLLAPYVGLGLAIHRTFGCFMNGCCYGRPTDSWFGVQFPLDHAGTKFYGVLAHLHPTQLYEAINGLIILAVLLWFRNRKKGEGEPAGLLLMIYAVDRYIIEFFRGDKLRGDLGEPMSSAVFIGWFILAAAAMFAFLWFVRSRGIAKGIAQPDPAGKVFGLFGLMTVFLFVEIFLGELLRTEPTLTAVGPISTSQFIGYLTFAAGFVIFVSSRYLGRRKQWPA